MYSSVRLMAGIDGFFFLYPFVGTTNKPVCFMYRSTKDHRIAVLVPPASIFNHPLCRLLFLRFSLFLSAMLPTSFFYIRCAGNCSMRQPVTLILPLILLAGCGGTIRHVHSGSEPAPASSPSPAAPRDIYADSPEVVRYDRYTLVGISPDKAQRDLLNQMLDISMPPETIRTVGDALRYVLLESGWSLCPGSGPLPVLFDRPLPAILRHTGPVRLHETLQLLAGPAWKMQTDHVMRQICFSLRPSFSEPAVLPPATPALTPPAAPVPTPRVTTVAPPQTRYGSIDVTRLNTGTVIPAWSPAGRGKVTLPVLLNGWHASITPNPRTVVITPSATPIPTATVPLPSTVPAGTTASVQPPSFRRSMWTSRFAGFPWHL